MVNNNPLPVNDFQMLLEDAMRSGPNWTKRNWTSLQRVIYGILCENYDIVHEKMHAGRGETSCNCQSWKERE